MKRRVHRDRSSALSVPDDLIDALESIYGSLDERETINAIADGLKVLHQGLTRGRRRFVKRQYLKDERIRLAYATYVVCAQAPKLLALLEQFGPLGNNDRPLRVLN